MVIMLHFLVKWAWISKIFHENTYPTHLTFLCYPTHLTFIWPTTTIPNTLNFYFGSKTREMQYPTHLNLIYFFFLQFYYRNVTFIAHFSIYSMKFLEFHGHLTRIFDSFLCCDKLLQFYYRNVTHFSSFSNISIEM